MITAEQTMTLYNALPVADQLSMQKYIKKLLSFRESTQKYELKPLSKADFLKMIDKSHAQVKSGKTRSWDEVEKAITTKYSIL